MEGEGQASDSSSERTSALRTLPTFERGSSGHSSICLGAFTEPIRCLDERDQLVGLRRRCSGSITAVDPLAPLVVGQPDDGAVAHRRVLHQRLLDLGRVHVEAAGDDHVLQAVDDEQVAVVVEVADVARVVPAVASRRPRSPRGSCSSRPSRASRARRSRRARRSAAAAPVSGSMIPTVTSGAGRPAEARRCVATLPSALKWSAGGSIETIIGASVWPNSCAITGPIARRAPRSAGRSTSAPRRTRSTAARRGRWRPAPRGRAACRSASAAGTCA